MVGVTYVALHGSALHTPGHEPAIQQHHRLGVQRGGEWAKHKAASFIH